MEEDRKLKTYMRAVLVLLALFVLLFASIYYLVFIRRVAWTNDAFIEGFGTDLSANVTEKIMALYFDEGDFVKKGDLIAELQSNVPEAKKKAAQARILSSEEEIKAKDALFKKIRNDYIRALEGIETQVISAQAFDHAEKNFEIASAELELAKANLELAKRELEVIDAELIHYRILAPFDGAIATRWVWLGDVINKGQSLFTMYDLQNVWVTAYLEETKVREVEIGDSASITIDAYPGYTFSGQVFAIKWAAASQFSLVPQNTATGNFTKVEQRIPIKISIAPPEDFPKDMPLYLLPGMSAEVWFTR